MSEEIFKGSLSRLNSATGVYDTIPQVVDVSGRGDPDALIDQLSEGRESISCTLTFNQPAQSTALIRWHRYIICLIMRRERQKTKMSYTFILAECVNQSIFPIEEGLCP